MALLGVTISQLPEFHTYSPPPTCKIERVKITFIVIIFRCRERSKRNPLSGKAITYSPAIVIGSYFTSTSNRQIQPNNPARRSSSIRPRCPVVIRRKLSSDCLGSSHGGHPVSMRRVSLPPPTGPRQDRRRDPRSGIPPGRGSTTSRRASARV
jgi:hypothetical protein